MHSSYLRNYEKDETVSAVFMHMGHKAMKILVKVCHKIKELGIQILQLRTTSSFTCTLNTKV